MRGHTSPFIHSASRELRKQPTDAEQKLWQRLRHKQLGAKFRRQHPFRTYIVDFVCLERRLVIEIDGGQHAEMLEADNQRTAMLKEAGFTVLRFWNNEVLNQTDDVVAEIYRMLGEIVTPSPPQPSP